MECASKFRILNRGNLKAVAEIIYGDLKISGVKVMENEKGLWVGMPSRAYKKNDGTTSYASIVWIEDQSRRRAFQDWVIGEFRKAATDGNGSAGNGGNGGSGVRAHAMAGAGKEIPF
ncbi:MAG: septation protein SpoVG family protein [Planctomycetota bacterium]